MAGVMEGEADWMKLGKGGTELDFSLNAAVGRNRSACGSTCISLHSCLSIKTAEKLWHVMASICPRSGTDRQQAQQMDV
eukprot:1158081-Pelagomonas_calceolata.AAC.5